MVFAPASMRGDEHPLLRVGWVAQCLNGFRDLEGDWPAHSPLLSHHLPCHNRQMSIPPISHCFLLDVEGYLDLQPCGLGHRRNDCAALYGNGERSSCGHIEQPLIGEGS